VSSFTVADLGGGVHRITHPLPWALNHVHCYAVAGSDGWTLIDAGLGRDAEERWCAALDQLGRPRVTRIVLTHYHPDHIGGSAALARLTGAEEVLQGARDAELARRAYTDPGNFAELERFLREQGMPSDGVSEAVSDEHALAFAPAKATRLLEEGDVVELGGEEFAVLALPGHADGHIAFFGQRSGRLFGGDVILRKITPNVGTWHDTQPDPLARYLSTLGRIADLRPAVVYPGHHEPLEDAADRAVEIQEHHRVRLDVHQEALRSGAVTPYDVSLRVWGTELGRHERRFALVEAISHLVRLARLGRAEEASTGRWRAL
jgi:glyoxylase-like metal-dependent hydrolase (beta-lactamase superfamily II)